MRLLKAGLDAEGGEEFWGDGSGDRQAILHLVLLDGTGAGSGIAVFPSGEFIGLRIAGIVG